MKANTHEGKAMLYVFLQREKWRKKNKMQPLNPDMLRAEINSRLKKAKKEGRI
jgi:hypothetical protein